MADNYLEFSQVIPNLTGDEEQWLVDQLAIIRVYAGREYPNDAVPPGFGPNHAEFIGCRAFRDLGEDALGSENAEFIYEFQTDDSPGGYGRHLWIYGDEYGNLDQVAHLVHKFLQAKRPKDCWSLTYAATCSKPRVGEFSGGALFITAAEIQWHDASQIGERLRAAFHQASAESTIASGSS